MGVISAYLRTAGCWAVSGGVRQPEPPGSGGGAGRPARRPPWRCAPPSRSATACHSEGRGTSRTGPPDRFPRRRRKSPLRELGATHTHTHTIQVRLNAILGFYVLLYPAFLMQSDTMLLGEPDDLHRFMSGSADSSSIFHSVSDAAFIHNGSKYPHHSSR